MVFFLKKKYCHEENPITVLKATSKMSVYLVV